MPRAKRFILSCYLGWLFCWANSLGDGVVAADAKPAWQVEWDKTVKAAEDEGAVVLYVTGAFEPVFREAFQKR